MNWLKQWNDKPDLNESDWYYVNAFVNGKKAAKWSLKMPAKSPDKIIDKYVEKAMSINELLGTNTSYTIFVRLVPKPYQSKFDLSDIEQVEYFLRDNEEEKRFIQSIK